MTTSNELPEPPSGAWPEVSVDVDRGIHESNWETCWNWDDDTLAVPPSDQEAIQEHIGEPETFEDLLEYARARFQAVAQAYLKLRYPDDARVEVEWTDFGRVRLLVTDGADQERRSEHGFSTTRPRQPASEEIDSEEADSIGQDFEEILQYPDLFDHSPAAVALDHLPLLDALRYTCAGWPEWMRQQVRDRVATRLSRGARARPEQLGHELAASDTDPSLLQDVVRDLVQSGRIEPDALNELQVQVDRLVEALQHPPGEAWNRPPPTATVNIAALVDDVPVETVSALVALQNGGAIELSSEQCSNLLGSFPSSQHRRALIRVLSRIDSDAPDREEPSSGRKQGNRSR